MNHNAQHFVAYGETQQRERARQALKTFDLVFKQWQDYRHFGTEGRFQEMHRLRPDLHSKLVSAGLTGYPVTRADPLLCYEDSCDLSCENHAEIRGKLARILARYAETGPWEQSLLERLSNPEEVFIYYYTHYLSQNFKFGLSDGKRDAHFRYVGHVPNPGTPFIDVEETDWDLLGAPESKI